MEWPSPSPFANQFQPVSKISNLMLFSKSDYKIVLLKKTETKSFSTNYSFLVLNIDTNIAIKSSRRMSIVKLKIDILIKDWQVIVKC